MKPYLWITLFVVLLFGVGWTSHSLTETLKGSSTVRQRDAGSHHYRHVGPYLSTVETFADELSLSEEQRAVLTQLLDETTREVRRRERAIRQLLYETRSQVDELLTDAQEAKLSELNEKKWLAFRAARLERAMQWFREETSLDATQLAAVENVLSEFGEEESRHRRRHFRSSDAEEGPSDRDTRRARLSELTVERNARLSQILEAEVLERFLSSGFDRRRSLNSDGPRGRRRGWQRSGDEPIKRPEKN